MLRDADDVATTRPHMVNAKKLLNFIDLQFNMFDRSSPSNSKEKFKDSDSAQAQAQARAQARAQAQAQAQARAQARAQAPALSSQAAPAKAPAKAPPAYEFNVWKPGATPYIDNLKGKIKGLFSQTSNPKGKTQEQAQTQAQARAQARAQAKRAINLKLSNAREYVHYFWKLQKQKKHKKADSKAMETQLANAREGMKLLQQIEQIEAAEKIEQKNRQLFAEQEVAASHNDLKKAQIDADFDVRYKALAESMGKYLMPPEEKEQEILKKLEQEKKEYERQEKRRMEEAKAQPKANAEAEAENEFESWYVKQFDRVPANATKMVL